MLDLYLIRHAESLANLTPEIIAGRSIHSPLTEKGIVQANILGERLKKDGIRFDLIHSSTAKRVVSTVMIVSKIIGYPAEDIIMSDELLELSQGDWEGKIRNEIYTPEVHAMALAIQPDFTPLNGESQRQVEQRMNRYIFGNFILNSSAADKTIGIFTHGMAKKCFLRGVLGSDPKMTHRIHIENTGITRLIFDDKGWQIITINDAHHLQKGD